MIALHTAREARRLGSDRELRHAASTGTVTRVATGVYVDARVWAALDSDDRYRTRVRAAALISGPRSQFSHDSAAAMWGLPSIGRWPDTVHELVDRGLGGSSRVGITRHALGKDPSALSMNGITVTGLERTVIDVAATTPFVRAVAMADAALRRGETEPQRLEARLDELGAYRGSARATAVVEFADGRAESAGESMARVQFHALGYPPPELQVPFGDTEGRIGTVDFFWPGLDLIVEFDGRAKYGDARRFQRGLTIEEVVFAEKEREDRLRGVARAFARLDWATTFDRDRLAAKLARHGLSGRYR